MKLIVCLLLFFGCKGLFAQHCAFDGTSVIVVHFNSPLKENTKVVLQQVSEADTDSCLYGEFIHAEYFLNNRDSAFNYSGNSYKQEKFISNLDNYYDFTKNNYFVTLSDSKRFCIQRKGTTNDYVYKPKKFRIVLLENNREVFSTDVPEGFVFPLCSAKGSWERIRSVKVQL